jgi:multiple sugar transport system permease protein
MNKKPQTLDALGNLLFVLPQFALFLLFVIWPVIRGIQISLYDWKIMLPQQRFLGAGHYIELWGDPKWWNALRTSFAFTGLVMLLGSGLALLLALILRREFRGRDFFRAALYLPAVLSVTVVGIVAFRVFDPNGGLINEFLVSTLGVEPIRFWSPGSGMAILVLTTVWWTFGFPVYDPHADVRTGLSG